MHLRLPKFLFPKILGLGPVFGPAGRAWSCYMTVPVNLLSSSPSLFLTKFDPAGNPAPVQVPVEYATLPRFGLAAFRKNEPVQAHRLYSQPVRCDAGVVWEVWLSVLTAASTTNERIEPNPICPQFSGTFYLAAHAAPTIPLAAPLIPLNSLVMPASVGCTAGQPAPPKYDLVF